MRLFANCLSDEFLHKSLELCEMTALECFYRVPAVSVFFLSDKYLRTSNEREAEPLLR